MKILQVHNYYSNRGGEDVMFDATCQILEMNGHHIIQYTKDSRNCIDLRTKILAFVGGIYSLTAEQDIRRLLEQKQPDLIHVHNLYPYISCSVLRVADEAGIPVVMRCPNYRLVCPIGTHLRHGQICERCAGGRELSCIRYNCRENISESVGYALRTISTRKLGSVRERVACFIPPSAFVKQRLIDAGFPSERIYLLPNMVPPLPEPPAAAKRREYVAFVGRITAC